MINTDNEQEYSFLEFLEDTYKRLLTIKTINTNNSPKKDMFINNVKDISNIIKLEYEIRKVEVNKVDDLSFLKKIYKILQDALKEFSSNDQIDQVKHKINVVKFKIEQKYNIKV